MAGPAAPAPSRHRFSRTAIASVVVLAIGSLALLVAAPTFLLFVPVVMAAWILARFGWVPHRLHARHESVKMAGGPDVGSCASATFTIVVDEAHRQEALGLLRDLFARLDAAMGSPGLDVTEDGHAHDAAGAGGSIDEAHAHLVEALLRPAASGDAPVRIVWRSEPGAPSCSAEVRAKLGRTSTYEARLVAPRAPLESAARAFALGLRESGRAEVWTSGWIRHAEQHDAARTRGVRSRERRGRDEA